jgi:soluble cytochrome b562
MKLLLLSLALLSAGAPSVGFAAETTASPLDDHMEEINAAYRKLGRQIGDASKNADSLKQVALLRQHAMEAEKLEPKKKADLPAPDQAKFVEGYRAKMKDFLAELGKLEDALKAGKNQEAATALKALKQAQEDGHKEFRRRKVTFEEKAAAAAKANEK